jgi:heme A synthase
MKIAETRFRRYSWFVLAYIILVILWGAYVRATGSGAGCGNHWPLCNGEVIPTSPELETLIEFSHRLTSGIGFIFVVILCIAAFRIFPPKSRIRYSATVSLFFMITEALVGAGLVLFGLVAEDDSFARAWVMAFHLVNTFLLLGSLTLCAWWTHDKRRLNLTQSKTIKRLLAFNLGLVLLVGISGAIAALGDTLFPSESLTEALRADFSTGSHLLIRLRIYHPLLAIILAVTLLPSAAYLAKKREDLKNLSLFTGFTILVQLAVGLINLVLLAPVSLQMLHLFIADLIWISLVILTASALAERKSTVGANFY